jgi:hypothetical protein
MDSCATSSSNTTFSGTKPFGRDGGGGKSSWAALNPTTFVDEDQMSARRADRVVG